MKTIKICCPGFNYEVFHRELIEHNVEIIEEEEINEDWIFQLSVDDSQLSWIESLQEEGIDIQGVTEDSDELKEFSFFQDQMVSTYIRVPFTIKAKSKEEAIKKAKEYENKDVYHCIPDPDWEWADDNDFCELDPDDIDGKPTKAIYYKAEDGDVFCIACNGDGSYVDYVD